MATRRLRPQIAPDAVFRCDQSLVWQKGLISLLRTCDHRKRWRANCAAGGGDSDLESRYRRPQHQPGSDQRVHCHDETGSSGQAGVDALVVPSRFEPCGLTQLCALRYGAVAIVSRVGGLADTVIDADEAAIAGGKATGVQFGPVTVENLAGAIRRAGTLFNDKPVWRSIQKKGMTFDVSWRNSARRYADLYRQIVKTRANSS